MADPIIVSLPDRTEAEFPAETPLQTIQAAIQKRFPPTSRPTATGSMAAVEGASPWEVGQTPTPSEALKAAKPIVRTGAQLLTGIPTTMSASPVDGGAAATLAGMGVDYMYGDVQSPSSYATEAAVNTLLPAGAAKGLEYFGRGAVRSALKIPPTQVTREGGEKIVDTVIRENLRVGAKGMERGKDIVSGVENALNKVLAESKGTVDVGKVVDALQAEKLRFKGSLEYPTAVKMIDGVIDKFTKHDYIQNLGMAASGGKIKYTGEIPLALAQDMKKVAYQELKTYYRDISKLVPKAQIATTSEAVGKAAMARELREQIMSDKSIPPEATEWLKRESNVLEALKWIQRRANVGANMDPITFNDVLVGGLIHQGVPAAVAVRFVRMPAIQSQLGIWMAKAAPEVAAPLQAGLLYGKGLSESR